MAKEKLLSLNNRGIQDVLILMYQIKHGSYLECSYLCDLFSRRIKRYNSDFEMSSLKQLSAENILTIWYIAIQESKRNTVPYLPFTESSDCQTCVFCNN